MKQRACKLTALTVAVFLLLTLLAGCGRSSYNTATDTAASEDYATGVAPEPAEMEEDAGFDSSYATEDSAAYDDAAPADQASDSGEKDTDFTKKIIYSGYMYVETTEFDKGLADLSTMVELYDGFLESSDVSGCTTTNSDGTTSVIDRYACYVVRIPCDSFQAFMEQAGSIGNVVNNSINAENITSQFTDSEAYLESLQLQEERLLAMMEQATDVDTLVTLESRLSEVRYEIEATTRQLRNWQQQVDYSTVTVNLQEVSVYTPTVSTTRTFGQRVSDAFRDGWQSFGRTLGNLAVGLIAIWPGLIILALIVLVVVLLIKRGNKKAAQRRQAYDSQQTPPTQQNNEEK